MIDQDEKHLTKLDLTAKNLKKIEKFSSKIQFDVAHFDSNEITKIEHLDVFHHLIEVKENPNELTFWSKENFPFLFSQLSISQNRLIDIRLLSRLKTLEKLNLSHNSIDSVERKIYFSSFLFFDIKKFYSFSFENFDKLDDSKCFVEQHRFSFTIEFVRCLEIARRQWQFDSTNWRFFSFKIFESWSNKTIETKDFISFL